MDSSHPGWPTLVNRMYPSLLTCVSRKNTTFGGTRGFTRQPSSAWVDDDGNIAGIVHQERGILYALFNNVGSFTPYTNPTAVRIPPLLIVASKHLMLSFRSTRSSGNSY